MRPVTRGDCADRPRPCPWASCSWHVVTLRRDVDDVETLAESCVLDVADREGAALHEVGDVLGVSWQRVRQIEEKAIAQLQQRRRLEMIR